MFLYTPIEDENGTIERDLSVAHVRGAFRVHAIELQ
jgi:hypothetical protein